MTPSSPSMVEIIARAMHRAYATDDGTGELWEDVRPTRREAWIALARAALEALREPTKAMLDAAMGDGPIMRAQWRRAIDAALSEQPNSEAQVGGSPTPPNVVS